MNLRKNMKKMLAVITSAALVATVPMTALAEDVPALDDLTDILDESQENVPTAGTVSFTLEESAKELVGSMLGADLSWLNSAAISACAEDAEDGMSAGAFELDVNDQEFLSGSFKFDPETSMLYLQLPDLREEAMAISVNITAQAEASGFSTEQLSAYIDQVIELIGSISDEEVSTFIDSLINAVSTHMSFDEASDVEIDINGVAATVSKTILAFDEENFGAALKDLVDVFSTDPLVEKVLTSGLADSISQLISKDAEPGYLNGFVQGLLSMASGMLAEAQLPGFDAYYEADESGDTFGFGLEMLLEGAASGIFEVLGQTEEDEFNIAINLGELLKSAAGLTPDLRTGLAMVGGADAGTISLILEDTDLVDLVYSESTMELYFAGELYLTCSVSDECTAEFNDFDTASAIPVSVNATDGSADVDEWASGIDTTILEEKLAAIMGYQEAETEAAA